MNLNLCDKKSLDIAKAALELIEFNKNYARSNVQNIHEYMFKLYREKVITEEEYESDGLFSALYIMLS